MAEYRVTHKEGSNFRRDVVKARSAAAAAKKVRREYDDAPGTLYAVQLQDRSDRAEAVKVANEKRRRLVSRRFLAAVFRPRRSGR